MLLLDRLLPKAGKEALTPEQLAEARERLSEQAEAERTGELKP